MSSRSSEKSSAANGLLKQKADEQELIPTGPAEEMAAAG